MWIPAKAAFRAGNVGGTPWDNSWDDANVGNYSTAMGSSTRASGDYSTARGSSTRAIGPYCTAMGVSTTAGAAGSTAMGGGTTASGNYSTAMGNGTTASGDYSTAMGNGTTASGQYTTAIGYQVSTNGFRGSFTIGDASTISGITPLINCSAMNQFMAVFEGGYTLYTSRNLGSGVYLSGGGSGWSGVCDRNKKENFRAIDGEGLLAKIRSMSIVEWNYKGSDPSIKYIGPVAQDFYAAFHLGGTDSLGINSICIDGVNMAAIQALEKRTAELREKTAELETVKSKLSALEERFARLEEALMASKDIARRVSVVSDENGMQR